MNNKGMTLGTEICIIVLFALLALLTLYTCTKAFNVNLNNNFVNYKNIEKDLENGARKYLSGKDITEKVIVTADALKSLNLFDSNCNGYVIVDKNYYEPYIKCGNYKTAGYSDVLDN